MNESDLYRRVMQGVDVDTTANAFWAAHPPSSVRQSISLSLQQSRACVARTPCLSSSIASSQHRPIVLASDHLLLWTTPSGTDWQAALEQKYPDSSLFRLFQTERMPAAEALLSQFMAAFTGTTSAKTLNNWLAGLQFWHIINGAQWQGAQLLHHTHHGFSKMVPSSSRRTKCPPITIDALCILFDNLDLTLPFDAAVCAVALIAFWCCCRLGELVIPSINIFDPSKHVSRSVTPISSFEVLDKHNSQAAVFHIPWTKTTMEQGTDISLTSREHRTCPLRALERHLLINSDIPEGAPLFAYLTDSGWSPMMRPAFLARCNEIWMSQGFPNMPGHTFHIRGAMELLLQGVHPDVVSTQGRWSSDAFLEYWCHIDTILPLFITSSANTQRLADIDLVMDSFAQRHHLSRTAPSS
ncbi:hypothetical protein EV424DRAFT_1474442 [Suillus variegatus]|nr:hypothetical protein EV424DRAFT_1474442 [Suillus variegatus]